MMSSEVSKITDQSPLVESFINAAGDLESLALSLYENKLISAPNDPGKHGWEALLSEKSVQNQLLAALKQYHPDTFNQCPDNETRLFAITKVLRRASDFYSQMQNIE